MNIVVLILLLLLPTSVHADYLGCFEPNEAVEIKTLYLNVSGVLTDPTSPACDILDPNDTTLTACTSGPTKVGTLTGIYESSHTIPASPLEGVWIAKQKGTVDSVVKDAADYFMVVDVAGECPGRAGVMLKSATHTGAVIPTVTTLTNVPTNFVSQSIDASGRVKDQPDATDTEKAAVASTQYKVYDTTNTIATNTRKFNGRCLEATVAGNTERSMITGFGTDVNGNFVNLKGLSAAPTDGSALNVFSSGCN